MQTTVSRSQLVLQGVPTLTDDPKVETDWGNSFRCPHCGGLNDRSAEWCMQCSKRLVERKEPIDMNAGAPQLSEIVSGGLGIVAGETAPADALGETFEVEGKSVTWRCGRCQHRNDIKASVCASCGRSFTESARWIADTTIVPERQKHATLKALGIVSVGAVGMRLVAGFISPWAAFALFGGLALRWFIRTFRT